ncbi:MAG TPA: FliH/SctL family protein [Ramlibacter sp.]|nr:FliH/SctL family protein [Ramlibacter sp.]
MTQQPFHAPVVVQGLPLSNGAVRAGRPQRTADTSAAIAPAQPVWSEAAAAAHAQAIEAGHEQGLQRGLAEGRAQARAALDAAIAQHACALKEKEARLAALFDALQGQADAFWAAAEDDAVALCFETICRVLGDALLTPDGLRAQLAQLRAQAPATAERATVCRLHPQDLRMIEDARANEPAPARQASALRCLPDASVSLGGCVVEAAGGSLDARLETLLQTCAATLLEARSRRASLAGAHTDTDAPATQGERALEAVL